MTTGRDRRDPTTDPTAHSRVVTTPATWSDRAAVTAAALALAVASTGACAPNPASSAAPTPTSAAAPSPGGCGDVDVVFARGTNQPPGFGRVGDPFFQAITAGLPGRRVRRHAVDYPADSQQHFGPGVTDIVAHISSVAAVCPATRFVLGGYSQGALAVAAAIEVPVPGAPAQTLSAALSPRVAAVVVFGDPLGARSRSIETTDTAFRAQSKEFCNTADAVCGRRGPGQGTHHSYPDRATGQAAEFALRRLQP